jgi:hypothetical protein
MEFFKKARPDAGLIIGLNRMASPRTKVRRGICSFPFLWFRRPSHAKNLSVSVNNSSVLTEAASDSPYQRITAPGRLISSSHGYLLKLALVICSDWLFFPTHRANTFENEQVNETQA